jgi:transcriptional regulator with XRE-family HTH domain|tara:strand:- start:179 stop:409 length:231 start_codon:yes stop_codon:yes gene_type:complete
MSNELREIKKRLGWTNADIALATGVSESGVNNWFRSDPQPVSEPVIRLMRLIAEVVEHDCGQEIIKKTGIEIKERM